MLLHETLRYLPAQLLGPIFQFVSIIVWTHVLSPADMGAFALITAAQELAYVFTIGWFSVYTLRYYEAEGASRTGYLNLESAVLIVSVLVSVVIVLVLPLVVSAPWTTSLVLVTMLQIVSRAFVVQLGERARAQGDALAYTVLQVTWPTIGLLCGLALVHVLGSSVLAVLAGYSIAQIASLVVVAQRLGLGTSPRHVDRDMLRTALRFGMPLLAGAIFIWIATNAVRFIVDWRDGATGVGLVNVGWALGQRAASFAAMLVTAAAFPLAVRRQRAGGPADGQAQLVTNGVLLLAALAPACVGLSVICEPLVNLVVAEPFREVTVAVLPLAILAGALRNIRQHFVEQVFLLHARTEVTTLICAIDAALAVVCISIGLGLGGLQGAIAGAAVSAFLGLVIALGMARYQFNFTFPLGELLRIAAAVGVMAVVVRALDTPATLAGLSIAMLVGCLVYAVAMALLYPAARRQAMRLAQEYRSGTGNTPRSD